MAATFKTGKVTQVDSTGQIGKYIEDGTTGPELDFEISRPNVTVIVGKSVTVQLTTPSGRVIDIVVKIDDKSI